MNLFFAKLTRAGLSDADAAHLHRLALQSSVVVDARDDVVDEGHGAIAVHVLLDGWACQYRQLPDGRRQIGTIHLAGDVCDLDAVSGQRPVYGVLALTRCRVGMIPHGDLMTAMAERPMIRDILLALLIEENRNLIEQVVNLGRRSAVERTASLLCSLLTRLQENGEALDGCIRCPLTQADMADHLGLSTVHTNRALRDLRNRGVIVGRGNLHTISSADALQSLAGWS